VRVPGLRAVSRIWRKSSGVVRLLLLGFTGLATILVLGTVLVLLSLFKGPPSLTTDTRSAELPSSTDRVAFLGRYLKLRAPVSDAVFHVVFHDNGGIPPGPSDWSIVAALQVSPGDEAAWLDEAKAVPLDQAQPSHHGSSAYCRPEIPPDWKVTSPGTIYLRQSAFLVWHPEGVLEFSASTF